jgi:hypothetical protein
MNTNHDSARKISAPANLPQRHWGAVLTIGLIIGIFLAACGGGDGSDGGDSSPPGTEEFGLSRQGLRISPSA